MDPLALESELQSRLDLLESDCGSSYLVDDLPLRDLVAVVLILSIVTVTLVWWAY